MEFSLQTLIIMLVLIVALVVVLAFISQLGSDSANMISGLKDFLGNLLGM